MNNQIKTFDWKTKHITNEDLSQKLFNAVYELFEFIANNNTKLSLLKVDSNSDYFGGRKWNLKTSEKAIFMHCLPVGRNEEVTNEVIDGKQSVVWTQALNRIHIQKSIINWCLN